MEVYMATDEQHPEYEPEEIELDPATEKELRENWGLDLDRIPEIDTDEEK